MLLVPRASLAAARPKPKHLIASTGAVDWAAIDAQVAEFRELPADQVPKPVGWTLLILIYRPATHQGSIELPEDYLDKLQSAADIGVVVDMGPACYRDPRYLDEPWCRIGDVVSWPRYTGWARVLANGQHALLLNEDEIRAIWRREPADGRAA